MQGLVEEGSLDGHRGSYHLVRTIEDVRIPATVQAVLTARVDRLPPREKALVHAAAVIGRQFSGRLAGRVAGLDDEAAASALQALVEGEFVYETASFPEEEYTFKHTLTEEVAYRSQVARHRARTHAAVAESLAELDADRLDERASLIAHHHELAGRLLDAARWNARAATWAGFTHPTEAARHWRRVAVTGGSARAHAGNRRARSSTPGHSSSVTTGGWVLPARKAASRSSRRPPGLFAEGQALAEATGPAGSEGLAGHHLRRACRS